MAKGVISLGKEKFVIGEELRGDCAVGQGNAGIGTTHQRVVNPGCRCGGGHRRPAPRTRLGD